MARSSAKPRPPDHTPFPLRVAKRRPLAYTVGMDRLARLHYLFRQAAMDCAAATAPGVGHITPREYEVLSWVASGKTDADIAALLAISRRTVHKHLEHIYIKLGVETRTAAVMRARLGP